MTGPPKSLSPYVIDFCKSISASEPFYISVTAEEGDAVNDCIDNVRRRVTLHGGEAVPGWKIWEWYGIMIEAEFHLLWRSPDGVMRDVTPHEAEFDQVLFLPDPSLEYSERQINNIRRPLARDRRVREFIGLADASFELLNRGQRAFQHGQIELSGDEAKEFQKLERRKLQLMWEITNAVPERNDLCRCGSGKKAKRCCYK